MGQAALVRQHLGRQAAVQARALSSTQIAADRLRGGSAGGRGRGHALVRVAQDHQSQRTNTARFGDGPRPVHRGV